MSWSRNGIRRLHIRDLYGHRRRCRPGVGFSIDLQNPM